MKTRLFALTLAPLLSLFAGCDGDKKSDKLQIAVVPKGTNHTFWKSIHAGAAKAASEEDVDILWKGPLVESDREGQIKVVQNFITQQVDAITLAPCDEEALIRSVKEAHGDGIKVVIFDSGLAKSGDKHWDSFVATDNYAAGVKCGKKLAELMGGEGKAILLRHMVGSASTEKRANGFLEGLKEHGPEIELLSSDKYAGATVEESQEAANNLLNQFADQVDGIFVPNESATEGMMAALKDAGIAGKVKFVGFDGNDAIVKGIEEGVIHAVCLQDPFNMGYQAVKHAVAHLKGVTVERIVDTGSEILTKDNLEDEKMRALVNPPLDRWLKE